MKTNFKFACINGYKGTFEQYIALNYAGYCSTCARCGIEPQSQEAWLEGQAE